MENRRIEAILSEIAELIELEGGNPFKVRAYENAARAIASMTDDVAELVRGKKLGKVRGIGKGIEEKLEELVATGKIGYLEELRANIPAGLLDLLRIPGMGPKKAKALWEHLGIDSLPALEAACNTGEVAKLKGFGKKTQEKILSAIAHLALTQGRRLRAQALPYAAQLEAHLAEVPGVQRVTVAGSLRRGRETVKDVDVVVASDDPAPVMAAVREHPLVDEVIGSGETKTSVRIDGGLQVDVRVVAPRSFACALAYFTGSKEFNVRLRQLALEQGYSLNEYDLRPLDGSRPPELASEEELFAKLGLIYVPPELRENTGEVDAALAGKLPALIEPGDLRGVLHVHTTWSDGTASVADMVAEAARLGYEYVGISDHSEAASYANGLSAERLAQQREEVEAARAAHPGLRVFHGIEADILPDGSIDLGDEVLASLDFVVASVHSQLGMERDAMTRRLVRALAHPAVRVLGHPLGRRLLERDSAQFDWEPVLDAAAAHGVAIEVNGSPHRLDADWVHVRRIRARGIKLCLNPDAHSMGALDDARKNAVVEARRGWATAADVVNTLPLAQFEREFLRR